MVFMISCSRDSDAPYLSSSRSISASNFSTSFAYLIARSRVLLSSTEIFVRHAPDSPRQACKLGDLPRTLRSGCFASRSDRLQKCQQVGVNPLTMCRGETVWQSGIVDLFGSLNEFGRLLRRIIDRHDLIVLTVHDQGGHIEFLEVFGEGGLGKCFNGVVYILQTSLHTPKPELVEHSLRDLCTRPIRSIERQRKVLVELRTVLCEATARSIKYLDWYPIGIGRGLHHNRRHSGDQNRSGEPLCAVAA